MALPGWYVPQQRACDERSRAVSFAGVLQRPRSFRAKHASDEPDLVLGKTAPRSRALQRQIDDKTPSVNGLGGAFAAVFDEYRSRPQNPLSARSARIAPQRSENVGRLSRPRKRKVGRGRLAGGDFLERVAPPFKTLKISV